MKTQNKPQMKEPVGAGHRTIIDPAAPSLAEEAAASKEKAIANKPKGVAAMKAGKQARRPARSLRVASEGKKLVCRYCGSDDLAPSFVKRRDARCRACFKQRYGSALRDTKAKPVRQVKSAK
jgi:rubrerythrin